MKTLNKVLNIIMVLSLMFGMWPVRGVSAQSPVDVEETATTTDVPIR